jgi:glycosyltransferase involved in cell wall biosynthesis
MNILFLTLNPNLQGPLPKHNPLLIAALENLGCRVTRRTWGRHAENENMIDKFFGRLEDVGKALEELVRIKPDIMYVATTLDERALVRDIPLLLVTCWSPVIKVLKMHGSNIDPLVQPGHVFYKFLTRLLIRLSDAILLLSTEELEIWTNFEPKGHYFRVDNPFIPNNAANSGGFTNMDGKLNLCPTLLFVGRLIKSKGIFDLIDAMPLILRQIDCHLLIAGDGEEKEEIKRYIEKANLKQSVSLLGYLDSAHLSEIYRSTSVFILPTYFSEGFPTVISETMSFGLPIVTTRLRGSRDHLHDEVNALFVPPRNPNAIANVVVRLLKDPKLCEEMGRANLAKVEEFRPEKVAPKYIEIFSELIGAIE